MDALKQVFFPANYTELFSVWSSDAFLCAGGTAQSRFQGKALLHFAPTIVALDALDELRRITRTERYIELGSTVTLNRIIALGKAVPDVLLRSLEQVADSQVRNLATIGGNIQCRLNSTAALLALDARYELRSVSGSRWISAYRFSVEKEESAVQRQELLTRIRIPLEKWEYSLCKCFVSPFDLESRGVAVLIARVKKNVLSDIHLVFAGHTILHDTATETLLIGKKLPLKEEYADMFLEQWLHYLSAVPDLEPLLCANLMNFASDSVHGMMA
ncbi:MAG: FAD binding domain-containing protein [Spirochaetaceae bacterium]|jgi:CO/xanthine dehydrogenase FAD-binding subunit|nr:FAD binding domain-containing protein [Spirochaetaceae bacterium]